MGSYRKRKKRTTICKYLSFYNPKLNKYYKLPLVHIKLKHGEHVLNTNALIDSGATHSFLQTELIKLLKIDLPPEKQLVDSAGGPFYAHVIKIDSIEVLKGS